MDAAIGERKLERKCLKLGQSEHLIASEVCDSKVGVANGLDLAYLEKESEGMEIKVNWRDIYIDIPIYIPGGEEL